MPPRMIQTLREAHVALAIANELLIKVAEDQLLILGSSHINDSIQSRGQINDLDPGLVTDVVQLIFAACGTRDPFQRLVLLPQKTVKRNRSGSVTHPTLRRRWRRSGPEPGQRSGPGTSR